MQITAKELAQRLDTDPRTVRKFLREVVRSADLESPGKGSRWTIEAKDVKRLKTAFNRWIAAKAPKTPETDETPNEG